MNQSCKCKCACPEECMLKHIKNSDIHVTLEDKDRWNTAAEKSSGKDIDIDKYSTTEEVEQMIRDYVDPKGFLTSIPEYYETEEEVLALLSSEYPTKDTVYTKQEIDEAISQCMPLSYLDVLARTSYVDTLHEQSTQGINGSVADISYNASTQNLTVTKNNGDAYNVFIQSGGSSGLSYIELSAYTLASNETTPATPTGGYYDFVNYIGTAPTSSDGNIWQLSMAGMTSDTTHTVYISKRTFFADGTQSTWSTPSVYVGAIDVSQTTYNVVKKLVTVYKHGEVVKHTDGNQVYYTTAAPLTPVGGEYDIENDQFITLPTGWSIDIDNTVAPYVDPATGQEIAKTWFFSMGQISENQGQQTITWTTPTAYGIDYSVAASSIRFISINYSVLAQNVDITSETFQANIADRLSVNANFIDVVAQEIEIDSAITKFRGSVSATEFAVVKDNAYYTGTPGNVTKNTDIDQTLFSIAQNTNQEYDPTSPATDVVLNIWNPGQLEDHVTGTEQGGGGSKGTLTGNAIEYTVNPKKLAQSVTGTYSWAYNYVMDSSDSQNVDFDMRSSFCITPKSTADSIITLPDPKTYVGCTINGSFETVVYPNMLEYGTISGHGSTNNKTAHGPLARSIMQTGTWYTDDTRSSIFINFNTTHPLWNCVQEIGNILSDYSQPELHTVNAANPYGNLTNVPALDKIMGKEVPRITITDRSEYPFVRLNAVNDNDALLFGSYERTNSVVSLNTDFYKDLYYAYAHVFGPDTNQAPLLQYVFEDNVSTSNGSYDYDMIKELYEVDSVKTKIYIVPSVVGLKKILESKPLSFVATAKMVNTDRLTQTYTSAEKSCKFYYWDIVTTDFTIVAVYDTKVSIPGFDTSTTTYPFDITSEQDISASSVQQSNLAWDYIISSPTKFASLLVEAQDSCYSIRGVIPTLWALVENCVTAYTQNTNV